ncbi:MAG TPA: class I SAM-dependent methyltransferase [Acetobacteraceae bacterium]|nr:class I SAM-dependent methyltransferase [Acetobacteraceae bacterium]
MTQRICRFCAAPLTESFADLGMTPLSNAFVPPERAAAPERFYPLHAFVCSLCRLVQLDQAEPPQAIFRDYPYFSSYAESWLRHAERYAAAMMERFALGRSSRVVEVASNDGYLLQFFHRAGIPVLGIEPAENVACVARQRGIATDAAFFGCVTARRLRTQGIEADLLVANNVLAHVPALNDFVAGLGTLLHPDGVLTVEMPHLLRLIEGSQFDTIYHEHFSYFSLLAAQRIFAAHGLRVFDVAQLPTHGGSLRLFLCHAACGAHKPHDTVDAVLAEERAAGLDGPHAYRRFAEQMVRSKCGLLDFCIAARRAGQRMVGYGAPAKGNTLLNYCGIGPEFLPFTVDRNPHKQGMLLPGTRIPVRAPDSVMQARPDYLLILPWNLRDEVMAQMAAIRDWGGRFVLPIPSVQVL